MAIAPVESAAQNPEADDQINFRELFDIVWSGRWVVLFVLILAVFGGVSYALLASPVYESQGLVQVEQEQNGIGKSIDQLSSLIGSAPGDAPAETAILKSRMVLGVVIEDLKLYVIAEPHYFPVVGRAIGRYRAHLTAPTPAPAGLEEYAWGGETIRVTSLDFPQAWHDRPFTLIATGTDSYDLFDSDNQKLLSGKVGERASVDTPWGQASLFVQELRARNGTHFMVVRQSLQAAYSNVESQLTAVEQPRDSGIIALQVRATSAEFAAKLLNAIQVAYLRQNVERRSAQAEQSLVFLESQLPDLKKNVDEAQARLNNYQLTKGTVDIQRETELALTQSINFETERLKLIQEREAALQRFTAQHPIIATLNEQIRGVEKVQANLKKQVELLPETQQEVLSLMRDMQVNSQLYTALLNSAQELQVTKAGTVGNVRIIDEALAPLLPIKPKKKFIVLSSAFMGLLAGICVVFAMRALLRGVDRPEQIERATGLPTYATIPFTQLQTKLTKSMDGAAEQRILAGHSPDDPSMEAVRSLRTSLHFAMLEAANNIVMFTGPVAAIGKSFVSINLAATLAISGKRVVVIDGDLRRGRLHRYAGQPNKPGVSDYVVGEAKLEHIIKHNVLPNMDLISAGTRPPNPSEILMHENFEQLLTAVSKTYDLVLIDSPPILPVTDPAIIGRLAGTTLLVLKSGEHPARAIEESIKRLRHAGVQVRGTIFNQVGAQLGSYGYGTYGYSYGYSSYGYKSR